MILGVVFLDERLSGQLIAGAILIISSIAVVNWQLKPLKQRARASSSQK
jgi:drug/metabolite transporter (DMT)-like permease